MNRLKPPLERSPDRDLWGMGSVRRLQLLPQLLGFRPPGRQLPPVRFVFARLHPARPLSCGVHLKSADRLSKPPAPPHSVQITFCCDLICPSISLRRFAMVMSCVCAETVWPLLIRLRTWSNCCSRSALIWMISERSARSRVCMKKSSTDPTMQNKPCNTCSDMLSRVAEPGTLTERKFCACQVVIRTETGGDGIGRHLPGCPDGLYLCRLDRADRSANESCCSGGDL